MRGGCTRYGEVTILAWPPAPGWVPPEGRGRSVRPVWGGSEGGESGKVSGVGWGGGGRGGGGGRERLERRARSPWQSWAELGYTTGRPCPCYAHGPTMHPWRVPAQSPGRRPGREPAGSVPTRDLLVKQKHIFSGRTVCAVTS